MKGTCKRWMQRNGSRMTLRIQRDCYTIRHNLINILNGDAVFHVRHGLGFK